MPINYFVADLQILPFLVCCENYILVTVFKREMEGILKRNEQNHTARRIYTWLFH